MNLKRSCLLLLMTLALSACSKKEEPVETPAPTPSLSLEQTATIKKYGDIVTYISDSNSGLKEFTKDYIIVYPNKLSFNEVKISILQGGVNAYYSDALKEGLEITSTFKDGFSTDTKSFGFIYTSNWNTIIFDGSNESDIANVIENIRENSSIEEYENYEVNTDEIEEDLNF